MDIMLKRILSLIPKKPDGKYVHGAKKKFAESLGFSGGEIVTMWINGSSDSYKNYLYQISSLYNVSVEWLRGETDDMSIKKLPTFTGGEAFEKLLAEVSPEKLKVIKMALALSDDAAKERLPAIELIFKE